MKRIIKNPIFMFILGAVIFGGIGVVYAYVATASDVSYSPSDTSWNVSNVKTALDDLYTKSNTWLDPSYIDMATISGIYEERYDSSDHEYYSVGSMIASSKGLCIFDENEIGCFKTNNYENEVPRLQAFFNKIGPLHLSSANCAEYGSSGYRCFIGFGFRVELYKNGTIHATYDSSPDLECYAYPPSYTSEPIGKSECKQQ